MIKILNRPLKAKVNSNLNLQNNKIKMVKVWMVRKFIYKIRIYKFNKKAE